MVKHPYRKKESNRQRKKSKRRRAIKNSKPKKNNVDDYQIKLQRERDEQKELDDLCWENLKLKTYHTVIWYLTGIVCVLGGCAFSYLLYQLHTTFLDYIEQKNVDSDLPISDTGRSINKRDDIDDFRLSPIVFAESILSYYGYDYHVFERNPFSSTREDARLSQEMDTMSSMDHSRVDVCSSHECQNDLQRYHRPTELMKKRKAASTANSRRKKDIDAQETAVIKGSVSKSVNVINVEEPSLSVKALLIHRLTYIIVQELVFIVPVRNL